MGVEQRKGKEEGERNASVLHVDSQANNLGIAFKEKVQAKAEARRAREKARTTHG